MTLNIFRVIGDFCTNVLFKPYNALAKINYKEFWWTSNFLNTIFFLITASLFIYWLFKLKAFKKEGAE
ncbi:MAG: uracil phosphoribosyltransferase [Flavobacteriaceae bacterium]|nr:uracil phosphoribosyltransferase [Flavobacteriaceae bacterium]